MAFPDRVIGRMVSNLWFQIASTPPASPAVGAGAGASAPYVVGALRSPPALFGVPEHVPELTYVVGAFPGDNGFIQSANDYHATYGLNPTTFNSIENLVNRLRQGSAHIGRLRIVSHVGLDTSAGADANMNVALFQGDRPGVQKEMLEALAESDAAGLRAILGYRNPLRPTGPLFYSLAADILRHLRSTSPVSPVLAPLNLQTTGPAAGSDLEQFLMALSDELWVSLVFANAANGTLDWRNTATTTTNFNATQRNHLNNALELIRQEIEDGIANSGSHSAPDLQNFRTTVLGLSMTDLGYGNGGTLGSYTFATSRTNAAGVTTYFDPMTSVGNAHAAMTTRDFRTRLGTMRARFDRNSFIDIRGCRVGQDQDFLVAVRKFFGPSGDLPTVSGPEWFQSFSIGAFNVAANEAAIDNFWNNGSTFNVPAPGGGTQAIVHTAQTIQDMFDEVQTLSGIDIHIDFWDQVTQLDTLAFAAMLWKSDLPALPIEAPRLTGIDTMDFGDTMERLVEIFDVGASLPSAATRTRITNRQAQLAALVSEIIVIGELASQSSPSASEISQSFSRLQTINTQLSLSTVPATAPSPLQLTHLQTYSERLKKHFEIVVIPNGPASFYQAYIAVEELAAASSQPASELTVRFNELTAVQTAIGAAGIVPASEPPGLDIATLQGYIQPLINHLNTSADLLTFKQAVNAKTQQGLPQVPAAFRYYFFVGLTLFVDEMDNWCYFALNNRRNGAIRSFMRAHWQEPLPTPNNVGVATMNQNAARQFAMLTETNNAGVDVDQYINPYPNYADHIVEEP